MNSLYLKLLNDFCHSGNVPSVSASEVMARTKGKFANPVYNELHNLISGFPVITNWTDPIQYACQKNVLLGIGDVNTHRDKNLPGNTVTTDEPTEALS